MVGKTNAVALLERGAFISQLGTSPAFVSKKLVAVGQNGLSGIEAPQKLESLATGDMEGTMQRIIKGCEETEYKKFSKRGFFSADALEKYKQAVKEECTPS